MSNPAFASSTISTTSTTGQPSGVQVFIPAALNRPTHTLYSICMVVQPTAQEWTVNRRYSQFLQLKKDIIAKLTTRNSTCPGCASFHRAVAKFPFPHRTLYRSNSVVRKRVVALQDFLKLLVERIYNDVFKCQICGDAMKQLTRPFLMRGAQPMNGSIQEKIQMSLSLVSYAVVPKDQFLASRIVASPRTKKAFMSSYASSASTRSDDSTTTSSSSSSSGHQQEPYQPQRNDSDPPMLELSSANSPTNVAHPYGNDDEEDEIARKYADEKCHDPSIPLSDAMKQVVLAPGSVGTYEEVVFRLTSMWDAYDIDETIAQISPERLSRRMSTMTEESVTF